MAMKFLPAIAFALLVLARPADAVVNGQVDTFQDGSLENWQVGSQATLPLLNIPNGGPTGAGDRYMQMRADGGGASGRLVAFSVDQWVGNYIAAGVTSIQIDLL